MTRKTWNGCNAAAATPAGSAEAVLDITPSPPPTLTSELNISGDGLLEFAGSSGIGTIAGGAQIEMVGARR
jgi:hypothetical protein